MSNNSENEEQMCELCPRSGTRYPSRSITKPDIVAAEQRAGIPAEAQYPGFLDEDYDFEHVWVACSKCDKWFHAACCAGTPYVRDTTVPSEVVQEMKTLPDEGTWADWTKWVEKW